ncbi:MAG: amino acid ABC transporter ATP-binding protein [Pseudolysinimonas sp.]
MNADRPLVRIRNLSKSFGSKQVLYDINLDVGAREIISIVGPSGSGKSTLLRCINRLEEQELGEVWVGDDLMGFDVRENEARRLSPAALAVQRRHIGMVFQQFHLFRQMTVMQNMIEGPTRVLKMSRADAEQRAIRILEKVGLASRTGAFPSELSGGEQQRIAIGRSLAMSPSILLFDEPTSALDPERVGEVLDVIRDLAAERAAAIVIVTHELDFAREISNRIIFMDNGAIDRIVAPDALLNEPTDTRFGRFLGQMYANRRHLDLPKPATEPTEKKKKE